MTVIAWDGRNLVGDGRATRGSVICSETIQKVEVVDVKNFGKCAVGICGALHLKGPLFQHLAVNGFGGDIELNIGMDEEGPIEMQGILVTPKGVAYEFSSLGGWYELNGPTAIGSGGSIASHYLLTGHDALTAVQKTCLTDITCGGNIVQYNSKTKKVTNYTKA